jgi:predicted nucleic acid-binding protein
MKILFDTCVLYPTVMRHALMGGCRVMGWQPLWSERILEEWARSARKLGPEGEIQARAEITLLRADWPKGCVGYSERVEQRLALPDLADRHVLAAAIAGSADVVVTLNNKDFPKHILWEEGVDRVDPDQLLYQAWLERPYAMVAVGEEILREARVMSKNDWSLRGLFKKARLPKFAKAIASG